MENEVRLKDLDVLHANLKDIRTILYGANHTGGLMDRLSKLEQNTQYLSEIISETRKWRLQMLFLMISSFTQMIVLIIVGIILYTLGM